MQLDQIFQNARGTDKLAALRRGMRGADMQFGCVVRDLGQAMAQWSALLGVGPWVIIDQFPNYSFTHRGQPSAIKFTVAFAYYGDIQIELIRQDNDAPSPYKEFLDSGREGLQHFGLFVNDYAAAQLAVAEAELKEVYVIIPAPGANPTIYYESPGSVGPMIEVVDLQPGRRAFFEAIKQVTASWDGTRPVRQYGAGSEFLNEMGIQV